MCELNQISRDPIDIKFKPLLFIITVIAFSTCAAGAKNLISNLKFNLASTSEPDSSSSSSPSSHSRSHSQSLSSSLSASSNAWTKRISPRPQTRDSSGRPEEKKATASFISQSQFSLQCRVTGFISLGLSPKHRRISDEINLIGRGLLDCKTMRGFETERPIILNLFARRRSTKSEGRHLAHHFEHQELAISAKSSDFIIAGEMNQLEDVFENQFLDGQGLDRKVLSGRERKQRNRVSSKFMSLNNFDTSISSPERAKRALFRSRKHAIFIEMAFESSDVDLGGLNIDRFQISLDLDQETDLKFSH